jgi:hypothetical protein
LLAIATTTLEPCDEIISRECKMEMFFRASIRDNLEHCKIFHDDTHIVRFMNNLQEFADNQISWQGEDDTSEIEIDDFQYNRIPQDGVPLERVFNRHAM